MKKLAFPAATTLILFLASCHPGREKLITGKWKAVAISNPQLEQQLREQQQFIDTMGQSASTAEVAAAYGFSSIDSLKKSMQADLDQYKAKAANELANSWFEFRKDGVALLNFGTGLDSASWSFDEEGALVLDDQKLKGSGGKVIMEVDSLTEQVLHLAYTEDGVKSAVHFTKVK